MEMSVQKGDSKEMIINGKRASDIFSCIKKKTNNTGINFNHREKTKYRIAFFNKPNPWHNFLMKDWLEQARIGYNRKIIIYFKVTKLTTQSNFIWGFFVCLFTICKVNVKLIHCVYRIDGV